MRIPPWRYWITAAALLSGVSRAQDTPAAPGEAQAGSPSSSSPPPATAAAAVSPAPAPEAPAAPANPAEVPAPAPASGRFAKEVLPLVRTYCWDCHGDGADKGEVNFDKYLSDESVLADRKLWAGVTFHVSQWTMPPAKRSEQPTPQERDVIAKTLDQLLNPVDPNRPDPGRVTIRRLNRVEYNNTVRDILGVDLRPADDFPEDDTGYGFDNIGDVLALPPILMERYLTAADRVLAAALPPGAPPSEVFEVEDEGLTGQGFPERERGRLMAFNGTCGSEFLAPASGEYRLSAKVWATQAGTEPARLALVSGDHTGDSVDVSAVDFKQPQTVEASVRFEKGSRKIGVTFLNDFWDDTQPDPDRRDRNLYVLSLQVEGPVKADPVPPTPGEARLLQPAGDLGETPEAAEKILKTFAWRCFRRPVQPAELERLMRIYHAVRAQEEPHREALRLAMKAVMVSPYFLYRIQNQPDPNNPEAIVDIDEFALASRLSYWLWSSTPDDELLQLAETGQLRANLTAQVRRLLKDPKSRALPVNFGGQWLELRTLNVVAPDKDRFPQFSQELRGDMRRETEELFQCIVQENRSVLDFLSADFTFLNDRLANYYGIGGVEGGDFRRVSLPPESRRQGVLTHASVLTITSDPTRTSPVKRGKWVLENMLGIIPPPPPPNVPALDGDAHAELTGSVRQRLEAHRSKPGCASCHALMDPIGFGLENFNAIGQWRDKDGNFPVDSSGVLTTGQKFNNAGELAKVLLTDRRDTFLHALVNKMLTYALGRGTEPTDRPAVDAIIQRMDKENDSFESLVLGIAESVPFQKRRGDAFLKNHAADTAAPAAR